MVDPTASPSGQPRPYRSKKRKPCDACRRRRTGCLVEEGQQTCSLCRHRGLTCTFLSAPPKKKRRRSLSHEQECSPTRNTPTELAETSKTAATVIPDQTTVMPGQTFFYSGASGDQGDYLLRHLPFDANGVFGTSNWTIWRAAISFTHNAYFTIYPNVLLDANGDAFDTSQIPTSAATYHRELLDLYYRYIQPTLPILETRSEFEAAIAAKSVPASLLAAVYSLAVFFWDHSPELQGKPRILRTTLQSFVYKSVVYEIRNPTIRTLQALLLYLQFQPDQMREPNHPGSWVVTAQILADVLTTFYSPQRSLMTMSSPNVLSLAEESTRRLEEWRSQHMFTTAVQSDNTNSYTLSFAYYAIEALIRGAVFVSTGTTLGGLSHESQLFDQIFHSLEQLLSQNPSGLWISYCKGSLGIIGSFILTIYLSSIDEATMNNRQDVLQRYRKLLNDLSVKFEFAKLPSIRLNLFFRRVFPDMEEITSETVSNNVL
ncbi:hypothetical protein UA08_08359 [Talaromyces atroroseus]|uniref:Zn(2)-C6 fungal-type domain-containing protein n=1 Tax=Talaromyces atroroseus TaxID=1441469 RepID=A0A225AEN8_TALAT|nr:hypothetical protein UA08_08359 [Talaromyces atroroseus]OKL56484.1 hypothetical protein UA08_08359 [Talaromyces atroroseus]